MKRVLFITTKNLDYIRNVQELRLLKKGRETETRSAGSGSALDGSEHDVTVIGSQSRHYPVRVLSVWFRLLFTSFRNYEEIFIGFAPQLILPLFGKRMRRAGTVLREDFFISFYDTLCCDRRYFRPNFVFGRFLHRLDEKTLAAADEVICDTKAQADFFASEFHAEKDKLRVLYLEADRSIYRPAGNGLCRKSKPVILYFGSVLPLQGAELVLEAMRELSEDGRFHCVFIGPLSKNKLLYTDENVEYIRWLPQEALAERIAEADLCLAGHFNAGIEKAKRTIPGKAFIYEAMGKPMLLGDNAANREYFTESGTVRFVPMGSAEAIVKGVTDFFLPPAPPNAML